MQRHFDTLHHAAVNCDIHTIHRSQNTHLFVLSMMRSAIQLFLSSGDFATSITLGWSRGAISKAFFSSRKGTKPCKYSSKHKSHYNIFTYSSNFNNWMLLFLRIKSMFKVWQKLKKYTWYFTDWHFIIYSTKLHTFCIFTVHNFHFTNKVSLFKTILSTNWSRNRNRCSFVVRLAQYHESIKKKYAPFCEPSPTAHLSQYILCNST